MRAECSNLYERIAQLEMEKREHTLVIETLEPLPATRKCYRMIGDVLVERTVGETLPAVKSNRDGVCSRLSFSSSHIPGIDH